MCVCACICEYMLYMRVYACICVYMCVHVCICVYMRVYALISLYLAIYGCMSSNIAICGCIWLYRVISGCIAAAAAAAQHDYTFNFRKTCAFRPRLAEVYTPWLEGLAACSNPSALSGRCLICLRFQLNASQKNTAPPTTEVREFKIKTSIQSNKPVPIPMTRNVSARDLCDQLAFIYVLQLSVNIHESTGGCTNKYMYICIYVFIYIYIYTCLYITMHYIYLYIYLFVCLYTQWYFSIHFIQFMLGATHFTLACYSPNKRSFRDPGCVGTRTRFPIQGQNLFVGTGLCSLQGGSRGLPWPPVSFRGQWYATRR